VARPDPSSLTLQGGNTSTQREVGIETPWWPAGPRDPAAVEKRLKDLDAAPRQTPSSTDLLPGVGGALTTGAEIEWRRIPRQVRFFSLQR